MVWSRSARPDARAGEGQGQAARQRTRQDRARDATAPQRPAEAEFRLDHQLATWARQGLPLAKQARAIQSRRPWPVFGFDQPHQSRERVKRTI